MNGPITAVVLPGLDGTGLMLRDFAIALQPYFRVQILDYPTDKPFGYDELFSYVREHLPHSNYFIIGESFSGPLALRFAQNAPDSLKCVVLGASFARLDLPLKRILSLLANIIPVRRVPVSLLSSFLLGHWASPDRLQCLRQALSKVLRLLKSGLIGSFPSALAITISTNCCIG